MSDFVNIARAEVSDGQVPAYIEAFNKALPGIEAEEKCLAYTLSVSTDNPNVIWHYELYTEAAAFEEHRSLPHIVTFRDTITPLLAAPIGPQRSDVVAQKVYDPAS